MRARSGSFGRAFRLMGGAIGLVILIISLEFAASDWHGKVAHQPLIPRQQAERTAVAALTRSQPGTAEWTVSDAAFHNASTTVTDRGGNQRFGSSWTQCPWVGVGAALNRVGITCPPSPVWAIQVATSSRPTNRRALVEIDAASGEVLSWLVDDSLP